MYMCVEYFSLFFSFSFFVGLKVLLGAYYLHTRQAENNVLLTMACHQPFFDPSNAIILLWKAIKIYFCIFS